jgi:hypothetical protein
MSRSLDDLKARYRIDDAWRDLGFPGTPSKSCRSPFRDETNPSFSVFSEGGRFHDFATGASGTVIDFVGLALNADTKGAIRWIENRLGVHREPPPRREAEPKRPAKIPPLRVGTESEVRELADRRSFSVEALRLAEERGFLRFASLWGQPSWCLRDGRGELFEFRRLDGRKFDAYGNLAERKSHCIGTGKSWPIGTLEAEAFAKVAWVEGAPDLLAAFHFLLIEGKAGSVAPVAVLGASNHRLAPEALAKFKGKEVRMFPHLDEAGRKGAREWALGLKAADAGRIVAFDLSGLVLADGTDGKDLADVCRISPQGFETDDKWREVLP